jgi:hypothetical protein
MKVITQEFDPAIEVATLEDHPENPRRGDTKAVEDSIDHNGFYGAILVQKSTGRVIAGHTRLRAAKASGAKTVPGIWLEVDDNLARRILLSDNRTSDLAYYDDDALFKALANAIEFDKNLKGTGYDDSTYRLLLGQSSSEPGDLYIGNVQQGLTPAERAPSYEATDIRSIILPYSAQVYDEVIAGLSELRTKLDVKTNADVIQILLAEAVER